MSSSSVLRRGARKILRVSASPLLAFCRCAQFHLSRWERQLSGVAGVSDPHLYSGAVEFPGLHADRQIYAPGLPRLLAPSTDRGTFFAVACAEEKSALEIGPLHAPICRRPPARVKYIDAFTTEELKEHYASDPNVDTAAIVDVDYVWRGEPYSDLIKERFDSVVTSHNVEHVPCLVSFLNSLECVLRPGGAIYLAVPDKRYCFDHFKSDSSISDVLDAFFDQRHEIPPSALVRQALLVTHNEAMRHWKGDHGTPAFSNPEEFVVRLKRMSGEVAQPATQKHAPLSGEKRETGAGPAMLEGLRALYKLDASVHTGDQHAWIFTPGSFAEIIFLLNHLGLTELFVDRLHLTAFGSHEFYAVLRKAT
jgi:2-polyprenyl-3-methyl-5-hydroxy-6-metoxy-1,4-benzoquinol methylase